ncbi:hypothetical protein ACLB6G_16210 [Zhengella sp. ZM62]|uniref:hypothetical protein n=1 Tax=Zhengella sedimenti TaxID=3390035 RepID=UPI0039750F99
MAWLVDGIGPAAATAVTWIVAVLVVVLLFLLVLRMLRSLLPGTYVRGGKSRHRLAVVDAAPVDARRRLILVRRDGVEHLLLIGGAGDVVVESGIGAPVMAAAPDRPVAADKAPAREGEPGTGRKPGEQAARRAMGAIAVTTAAPVAAAPRRDESESPPMAPAPRPAPPARPAAEDRAPRQPEPDRRDEIPTAPSAPERTLPREAAGQPVLTEPPVSPAPPAPRPEPPHQPDVARQTDLGSSATGNPAPDEDEWTDEALMRELQETLAPVRQTPPPAQARPTQPLPPGREMSLEEEMSQLLQDLTRDGNKP